LIYIDTSALLKLIFDETGTSALERYLPDGAHLISSKSLLMEARRGTLRRSAGRLHRLDVLLSEIGTVAISDAVIESASRLPDPVLRSLDAIHLATALLIREDISVLVSYDDRLTAAAAAHGLKTATPV
jgi:predicted nucleic acid-binding protein